MLLPEELFKPTSKQNEGHGMGLNSMLDESWSNRCTLSKQSAAPALDVSGAFQPTVCCSLGFCVHAGKGLASLRNAFQVVQVAAALCASSAAKATEGR